MPQKLEGMRMLYRLLGMRSHKEGAIGEIEKDPTYLPPASAPRPSETKPAATA